MIKTKIDIIHAYKYDCILYWKYIGDLQYYIVQLVVSLDTRLILTEEKNYAQGIKPLFVDIEIITIVCIARVLVWHEIRTNESK